MIQKLSGIGAKKIEIDLTWNLVSFFILGLCGLLLNFLIGKYYGPEALGIFNQAFAFYLILSLISVLGIILSVLKYTVEHSHEPEKLNGMISSALLLVSVSAFTMAIAVYFLAPLIGALFESPSLHESLKYISIGIFFFTINKVLLAYLNGLRHMRAYAICQSSRYLLIIIIMYVLFLLDTQQQALTLCATLSEAILFVGLVFYTKRLFNWNFYSLKFWVKKHLNFGIRGFLSLTLVEINTRVDLIMLGYFCSDLEVGIYSLPVILVEGVAQLSVVLRDNFNPILTKLYFKKKLTTMVKFIKKVKIRFFLFMLLVTLSAIFLYPFIIDFLFNGSEFKSSWILFSILMIGLLLSSGYLPFNMILTQTGYPGAQSFYSVFLICSNILLNAVLIPMYQTTGAALATGISWITSVWILKVMVKRFLKIQI